MRCAACLARKRDTRRAGRSQPRAPRSAVAPAPAASPAPTPRVARPEALDVATARREELHGYWQGRTDAGLLFWAPDDPEHPFNRLAAVIAQAEQLGRTDVAETLRDVLAKARERDRQKRARRGSGV